MQWLQDNRFPMIICFISGNKIGDFHFIWETIRENIKISAKENLGYYELKKHKTLFDERC
jgi:hypothetical protein